MKLYKALKLKKKLTGEIASLKLLILSKNSYVEGSKVNYVVTELYDELLVKINALVDLKMSINAANADIQESIYNLAELKGMISFWQQMPTAEGVISNTYSEAAAKTYVATFNEVFKDNLIKNLQTDVDTIQEEIDTYNYTKEV
jgi:soluble P-type ATPase